MILKIPIYFFLAHKALMKYAILPNLKISNPRKNKRRQSMKRLIIAMLLVLFISTPAFALFFIPGSLLIEEWHEFQKFRGEAYHDCTAVGHYMGYISGIADVFNGKEFKIPKATTLNQLGDVVGKYLEEHPAEWNNQADDIVTKALKKEFPIK